MAFSFDPFAPATDLLAALRERAISSMDLLALQIARIDRLDPTLNAIAVRAFDTARDRASLADRERDAGADAALLGLPLTIKETIDVAGLPGTAGVLEFRERLPEASAPLTERVLAAGGVLLGKTNVPPMAMDMQANNPIYGRTNNPWDLGRSPGGSTGGGAAALAAGLTPLEFGSDIGGSIRIPAAFCGVYGHRPSDGAVPRNGHFPGSALPNAASIMGVLGPLARSAADLELALDVIAGPVPGDEPAVSVRIPPARHERLEGFRVAVMPPIPWVPVDSEILAAQERVADAARRAGATVGQAQPLVLGDVWQHHLFYRTMLAAMTSPGLSPEQRASEAARLRATGDEFMLAWAEGLGGGAGDLIIWHGRREEYRASWRAFFREWDVLLAPIAITPAFPHSDQDWNDRWLDIDGTAVHFDKQVVYPGVATLSGQPATAFPAGLTRAGLPIGLQAIGPYLEDRTSVRFADLVAREIGGFQRPPGWE